MLKINKTRKQKREKIELNISFLKMLNLIVIGMGFSRAYTLFHSIGKFGVGNAFLLIGLSFFVLGLVKSLYLRNNDKWEFENNINSYHLDDLE